MLDRGRAAGLQRCITIGTGPRDARRARELARTHPDLVVCTAGLDPFTAHEASERFDETLAEMAQLLSGGEFVGLGEIGLDYHYDLDPRPLQRHRLELQLELAARLDLPVVIHVREAHADMVEVLADHARCRGVIHSFTAGPAQAERYLELGWWLAFNGVLTFPNAGDVREAARTAPLERLLVETDAPYLAPVPLRGKRCEPAHVLHTVDALARVRNSTREALAEATSANARALFRLPAVSVGDAGGAPSSS